MKLSHKLAAANIAVILVLVILFLSMNYVSNKTLLSGAMNAVDEEVMESFAEKLSDYYQKHQSWEGLVGNRNLWNQMVNKEFFTIFFSRSPKELPSPQIPAGNKGMELPFGTFLQRLTLMDAGREILIPAEIAKEDVNLRKIRLHGRTIGWLSVGKIDMDVLPLTQHFFNRQLYLTSLAGLFGGFVAVVLSFFLSRQITSPIKQLIRGARKISQRDFTVNICLMTRDELQELGQSFNQIAKELDRYETQQRQWLMDISHELRTPLTILLGEISAICDNLTKCDVAAVSSLREEVVQIKRLVDDLHDLSTINGTGFSFNKELIDLRQIVHSQLQRYQEKFSDKNLTLHSTLGDEPTLVYGDSDRLAQVVRNLMENCLRYTCSPGEVWVELSVSASAVKLAVQDSGPGVSQESLPKLFDRLYRADTSRNRVTGGAGLGLTICREILLSHSGSIQAAHSERGGLKIVMEIPTSMEG